MACPERLPAEWLATERPATEWLADSEDRTWDGKRDLDAREGSDVDDVAAEIGLVEKSRSGADEDRALPRAHEAEDALELVAAAGIAEPAHPVEDDRAQRVGIGA